MLNKQSLAILSMAVSLLGGCNKPHNPVAQLPGVWRVDRITILDTNTEVDPGNLHYMISPHYIMTVGGKEDRPVVEKNFDQMTPEEILSQLPAGGGFMRYEIKDGRIYRTTVFALSELFEGKTIQTEFEVDADTLVFRDNHYADGQWREWHMLRIE